MDYLIGNPISMNVSIDKRFFTTMKNSVMFLRSEIYSILENLFDSVEAIEYFAFDETFGSKIKSAFSKLKNKVPSIAKRYFYRIKDEIKHYSKLAVKNSIRVMSKLTKIREPKTDFKQTDASVDATVSLFESMLNEVVEKTEINTLRTISENSYDIKKAKSDISKDLDEKVLKAINRAKLISDHQTYETFYIAAREVLESYGITEFKWIYTYLSKHQREWHREKLNGNIYRFDDPPIIQESPEIKGYCGQLLGCKCKMAPVIRF